jgi:hypothetical protein
MAGIVRVLGDGARMVCRTDNMEYGTGAFLMQSNNF